MPETNRDQRLLVGVLGVFPFFLQGLIKHGWFGLHAQDTPSFC